MKPWLKKARDEAANYRISVEADSYNPKKFSIKIFKKGIGGPVAKLEMHYELGYWDLHFHIGGNRESLFKWK